MAIKWIKTPHKGLRYYEHPTRRHGKKKDRYYSVRFKIDGRDYTYGVGWWSDGIPEEARKNDPNMSFEEFALTQLKLYNANVKAGSGPKSPKEKRKFVKERSAQEQAEQERLEKENVTFGHFMTETYLPQCKRDKKNKTYLNEEGLYRLHLAEAIGDLPFSKISAFNLEWIKKDMADRNLSGRTIQYVLQLIRQAFHTARKLGVYEGESPTRNIRWPKLDNMKLRYLGASEADILLKALATRSKTLHDAALLSLHCGLRFGEIAALKWSCVNGDAGTLAILNAKSGSRIAYLTERAKEMLKQRESGKPDELIFQKRSGKEGPMAQASNVFNDVVDSLKLNEGITDTKQRVTFHTLRHSFATLLYENTHDLYLVQRSLGHATGEMSRRYAKMSENRLREGAEAIERALTVDSKDKEEPEAVNSSA
jgi:integrase